jgi:lysophospholipase L1-like esterase
VAHLRGALGCTVVNAGAPSDRVGDLLARLDEDVLSKNATATLIFIGGNDYFDGTSRGEFARQLDQVASRVADTGSKIVMVEVPSGIIWNRYAGIYRKVAHRYSALLVPESRLRWWYMVELLARDRLEHPLTLDGIHLSPVGAAEVAEWLEPYVAGALMESETAAGLLRDWVQE